MIKEFEKIIGKHLRKSFYGWIDYRDLLDVKRYNGHSSGVAFAKKHLTVFDKHWSDGMCRKVKIVVLKEQR